MSAISLEAHLRELREQLLTVTLSKHDISCRFGVAKDLTPDRLTLHTDLTKLTEFKIGDEPLMYVSDILVPGTWLGEKVLKLSDEEKSDLTDILVLVTLSLCVSYFGGYWFKSRIWATKFLVTKFRLNLNNNPGILYNCGEISDLQHISSGANAVSLSKRTGIGCIWPDTTIPLNTYPQFNRLIEKEFDVLRK